MTALGHLEMCHRPLIGIFPHRQLDLEKVSAPGAERCYDQVICPAQQEQVCVAFQVVAKGQFESVVLDPFEHTVERLNGDGLIRHVQVGKPEQLRAPIFQQNVHRRVFGLPPAMLDGTQHTGEVALPVPFPHPHHGAPTRFVPFHKTYLSLPGREKLS